jgi:CheY-like chemotaxis protein
MKPKIKVLVIDDEKQFAENLCRVLSFRDIDATAAFDGNKALKIINSSKNFDAVVLDIKMPGMNGIETLTEIKKISPETEVIMLTGHADIESGIEAIRIGAYDYLLKPCDIEVLAEKLNEAYQAKKIKKYPVLWPRKFVKEISLTGFIRLETQDPLNKAVEIFEKINIGTIREELHVLDSEDRLAGIITRSDLIREAYNEHSELYCSWKELAKHPEWLPLKKIIEVMRPAPHIFAHLDEELTKVSQRMFDHNLRYLPIITDGKFNGLIQLKDILQYVGLDNEMYDETPDDDDDE